ncbi:ATP-binding protein [Arenibacter amylolyticus]|uniref:ATP-binding protein n=1 Tax=Arenibacter amylolyticus TaxID=1406873 RepID=UPI001C3D6A04|nr:ATP-binding protein [Arenibacter amylolyticus]
MQEIKLTICVWWDAYTNLGFERWEEIFGDPVLTAAEVDRLTHKAYLINMNGESYRLKETKEMINK